MTSPASEVRPASLQGLITAAPGGWKDLQLASEPVLQSLTAQLTDIARQSAADDIVTLDQLLRAAIPMLCRLSNITSVSDVEDPVTADVLHRYRNLIGALACTSAPDSQTATILLRSLPQLSQRTHLRRGRPLVDDERLMIRLIVTHLARHPRQLTAAGRYVLAEPGATPGEVTAVALCDLDDPHNPRCFRVSGNRDRDRRSLDLDPWGAAIVARLADRRLASRRPHAPLVYDGDDEPGGQTANISAHQTLGRLLRIAGLDAHKDITPKSVTVSTAAVAAETDGDDAAQARLGRRSKEETLRELRRSGMQPSNELNATIRFAPEFSPYRGRPRVENDT